MKDYSLLIIKPEIMSKKEKIFYSLKRRGYKTLFQREFNNWADFVKRVYKEFSAKQILEYLNEYTKNKWGYRFKVLLVSYKEGDTITRLRQDTGNFISYQNKKENTLRAEFGLPRGRNIICEGITFTYNGFHSIASEKELKEELDILGLSF